MHTTHISPPLPARCVVRGWCERAREPILLGSVGRGRERSAHLALCALCHVQQPRILCYPPSDRHCPGTRICSAAMRASASGCEREMRTGLMSMPPRRMKRPLTTSVSGAHAPWMARKMRLRSGGLGGQRWGGADSWSTCVCVVVGMAKVAVLIGGGGGGRWRRR
jgi:hypothetical protein